MNKPPVQWYDTVPTDDGAFARLIRHIEQYPRCASDECGQNSERCPTPEKCGLLAPAPAEAATEVDSTPRPTFLRHEGSGALVWPVITLIAAVLAVALVVHLGFRWIA